MKPIRDYSEGQWLLLLWGFIVLFLLAGLFLDIVALVIVALLAAAGAGYTTYLYVQQNVAPRPLPPTRDYENDSEGGRA